MIEMNVPAVGRLTASDLMHLKVQTLVYLNELERSFYGEVSIFPNEKEGVAAKVARAREIYGGKIAYTKLLLEKLDDTVQAILTGELEVSPEAVAHLPRKVNR